MKVSARLGAAYYMPSEITLLSKSLPKTPVASHPIMQDVAAAEMALATLFRMNAREGIRRGLTPEQDLAAQQFRSDHGPIAALIADPVAEAICNAASILTHHLKAIVPLDQQAACAARLMAPLARLWPFRPVVERAG